MKGTAVPVGDYSETCRARTLDEFCATNPHPFLVFFYDRGTITPNRDAQAQTLDRFMLGDKTRVLTGQRTGTYLIFPLSAKAAGEPAVLTVGCVDTCDVVIDDVTVSRLHAHVERRGQRFFVKDNGSTNGTQINGMTATPGTWWEIESGDTLTVGALNFTFLTPADFHAFVKRFFGA